MHFSADDGSPRGRHIYMAPTAGGPPFALQGERDEPMLLPRSVDPSMAPFEQNLQWYEGRELRRLPVPVAERYIPIVETRLERNRELLDSLPRELEEIEHLIEADEAALAQAWAAVHQVMVYDNMRMGGVHAPNYIVNQTLTIDPAMHVPTRDCTLRETPEWQHMEWVKMSLEPVFTERKQRRGQLQRALTDEYINTTLLQSRLFHLREHCARWRVPYR
jgi:hypothetical protein